MSSPPRAGTCWTRSASRSAAVRIRSRCRLCSALDTVDDAAGNRRGFHTTAIAGVFGAAAAAARMLELTDLQTTYALGLVGSQAAGINEYLSNGSSAKTFHAGWSAHAGIVAAAMAKAGMTGPASVFEGRDGVLHARRT